MCCGRLDDHPKCIKWTCGISTCLVTFTLVVITITFLALSFKDIEHDEYGVEYYLVTRTVQDEVLEEGKHHVYPPTKVFKYPRLFVTLDFEGDDQVKCISRDGIYINLEVTSQHQLIKDEIRDSLFEYGGYDELHDYVSVLTRDAIKDACGDFMADDFIFRRGEFEEYVFEKVDNAYNVSNSHIDLKLAQVLAVHHPGSYIGATQSKQVVQQQIDVALTQRSQQLTDAQTIHLEAQEVSKGLLVSANATADGIISVATSKAQSIKSVWDERTIAFSEIKTKTGMTNDEFADTYLQYLVVISQEKPTIQMD